MKKSGLHLKLVIIMLLLIFSLMAVVCAFLVRGVVSFYLGEFYQNMQEVFSVQEFADDLRAAANEEEGAAQIEDILSAYSGLLGIDAVNRNYYVLDGGNAQVLGGSDGKTEIEISPNILTALNGREGYTSNNSASYMDVALPISGDKGSYIVYIKDNKQTVHDLNMELFMIIMEALVVGLLISVLLSFLLSKTMIIPIQSLTRGANRVAEGDFSQKIEVHTRDEIGVLTESFNDMARQLKDTLEAIDGERNKLSTVFLHMTDGVVAFNHEGVKIHYNPAAEQLLGVSLEDADLDYSVIFGSVEDKETVLALKAPTVIRAEREIKDKTLEIILAPFAGSEGGQNGILALIHDVTQQRKSEQMHREFVANVSHELRTPITNIRSYAETLEDVGEEMPPDDRKHFLQVILNESDRMVKIVQELLMLSKFDAGDNDMRFEDFDIVHSTRNICEALRLNIEKRNMSLSLQAPDKEVICCGDRARLEQVIVNVITNAIRYTPDGGEISVKVGGSDNYVWVSVKDTGIGIPKENLPHIFDRFYRVDRARSRALGGSGLGLSIAKEIIMKHNGEISIDSEPGKGTKVLIRLPKEQSGGESHEA
ncbi:MAG: ATP-binding protein [Clostridiales bacterium]|nr:ATP-binding protein [Clostridiales bacterium]